MEVDLLDCLLSTAEDELKAENAVATKQKSAVHSGDTDSSDDEENRDCENRKYNEFGKSVKHLLNAQQSETKEKTLPHNPQTNWKKNPIEKKPAFQSKVEQRDIFTDPFFGIRVINPLVSHSLLIERMSGRDPVSMFKMKQYVARVTPQSDWVVAGVIVHKISRTSQKGNQFAVWTLSDLHNDLKTVSIFLFGNAFKELWKCLVGTVVGILNPSVLDKKPSSTDEASLSVDNSQKVMIFGQSKDLGTCKSKKKNGDPCTAFVNKNRCEFCIYHIKQEYQKCSIRSDIQSGYSGRGLTALRNKVLGKNEVFYAGKSFTAIPAAKSRKLMAKDEGRLNLLTGAVTNSVKAISAPKRKQAVHVELSTNQRMKDMALLRKLGGATELALSEKTNFSAEHSTNVTLEESKSTALNVIAKLKEKKSVENVVKPPEDQNIKRNDFDNFLDENNLSDLDFDLSDTEINYEISNDTNSKPESIKSPTVNNTNNINKTPIRKPKNNNASKTISTPNNKTSAKNINNEIDKAPGTKMSTTQPVINKNINNIPAPVIKTPITQPVVNKNISQPNLTLGIPCLSGLGNKMIDLNSPVQPKHVNRAKQNALSWVQRNGMIKKVDPNTISKGKKRPIEIEESVLNNPKKQKILESEYFSARFKQMMAVTSKHTDLVEQHFNEEKEKYFNKLEMKEKMEEKMMMTYKVNCKAVRCALCKYTSFSATDKCKQERHPLKVFDAVKRFFKCSDCGNRTVSLCIIPTLGCKSCGSNRWERTTMMKEKKVEHMHSLSIRGGEQTFTNSVTTDANINLLVPDE